MDYIEFSGKTLDDALTEATIKLGVTSDKIQYELIEKGSSGFLGIGSKPTKIKAKRKNTMKDLTIEFLNNVFGHMGMQVETILNYNEENRCMDIELKGDDMGILIGKRGQTLDSLQYLVSLVVNRESEEYIKVKLDTENYRKRRRDTLENFARNIAYKVKKTRKTVYLEPMNPYERRVIHSALQHDKFVDTHSEGDEPYRKVVVTLKRQ